MHNLAKKIKDGDVDAFELFFKAEHDNLLFFVNRHMATMQLSVAVK